MKAIAIIAMASIMAAAALSGMAIAEERTILTTDRSVYATGQCVTITVTNNMRGAVPLCGYTITDSDGNEVYTPNTVLFMQMLGPGQSHSFLWDQVDGCGMQVAEGAYTINYDRTSATISIERPNLSYRISEETYSPGDEAVLTVTNEGKATVALINSFYVVDERNEIIYTSNALAYSIVLGPEQTAKFSWNLETDDGTPVGDGTYTMCAAGGSVKVVVITKTAGSETPETISGIEHSAPAELPPIRIPVKQTSVNIEF
jgi:flagellar hook assembly protein FlgD